MPRWNGRWQFVGGDIDVDVEIGYILALDCASPIQNGENGDQTRQRKEIEPVRNTAVVVCCNSDIVGVLHCSSLPRPTLDRT